MCFERKSSINLHSRVSSLDMGALEFASMVQTGMKGMVQSRAGEVVDVAENEAAVRLLLGFLQHSLRQYYDQARQERA